MKFSITHEFKYSYDSPVRLSTQYLRLTPRDTARQKVSGWSLDFTNRLLLHRAREFDSALEAWRPIHALDQSSLIP